MSDPEAGEGPHHASRGLGERRVLALEAQDEVADALEEGMLEVGLVRELRPDLPERGAQLRLQLRVERLGGGELAVKRLQRLVQAGAFGGCGLVFGSRALIRGGRLQSWRLRCA